MSFEIITESLIAAIEARPMLWDKACPDHKDRIKCKTAWDEVCVATNSEYKSFDEGLKDDYCEHNFSDIYYIFYFTFINHQHIFKLSIFT